MRAGNTPSVPAPAERTQLGASANAYEWTSVGVDGVGRSAGRARFMSTGTLLAGVLAGPVLRSDRVRLGAMLAKPVMWRPARIDAAFELPTGAAPTRVGYATTADLTQYVPGVAIAVAPAGRRGPLRLGAGLGASYLTLGQEMLVATRRTAADGMRVTEALFGADGSVVHLLATAGVQWDVAPAMTLGARVVTPGLRIGGRASMAYTDTRATGATLRDLVFRDDAARLDYRLPMRTDVGLAWRFARGAIEADLRHHGATATHRLYASDATGRLTESAAGGATTTAELPFVAPTHALRAVTNVAIGGNVRLGHGVRLHAGLTTDRSPVAETPDGVFPRVDLLHANVGASAAWRTVTGTLGLGLSRGRGAPTRLGGPEGAAAGAESRLVVRTVAVTYALAVGF